MDYNDEYILEDLELDSVLPLGQNPSAQPARPSDATTSTGIPGDTASMVDPENGGSKRRKKSSNSVSKSAPSGHHRDASVGDAAPSAHHSPEGARHSSGSGEDLDLEGSTSLDDVGNISDMEDEAEAEEYFDCRSDTSDDMSGDDLSESDWDMDYGEDLEDLNPVAQPTVQNENTDSAWKRRRKEEYQAYAQQRPQLMATYLSTVGVTNNAACMQCWREMAVVGCSDCSSDCNTKQLLCAACDRASHPFAHYHRRHRLDSDAFTPIPSYISFQSGIADHGDAGAPVEVTQYLHFNIKPQHCQMCGIWHQFSDAHRQPARQRLVDFIFHGKHKFCLVEYKCHCGSWQVQGLLDLVRVGGWPATTGAVKTLVHERELERWENLNKAVPGFARRAYVKLLNSESAGIGEKGRITQQVLDSALREYQFREHEKRLHLMAMDGLECAACSSQPHSVHIDGNCKLYIWDRNYEDWRVHSYYEGYLFDADDSVLKHLECLDLAMKVNRSGNQAQADDVVCNGVWHAARDSTRKYAGMFYTGRSFGVCRHQVPLKAANFVKSGERFGYAHYLLTEHFYPKNVKVVFIDVQCKFAPWETKAVQALRDSNLDAVITSDCKRRTLATIASKGSCIKVLPAAHGKIHDRNCQTLFGPVMANGSAGQAGEEAEQFFSMASRVARTSRNAGPVKSTEMITEASVRHGLDKRVHQPDLAVTSYISTEDKIASVQQELKDLLAEKLPDSEHTIELLMQKLPELQDELVQLAKYEQDHGPVRTTHALEYFKLSRRIQEAEALDGLATFRAEDLPARLVAGNNGDLAAMHRTAQALRSSLQSMRDRLEVVKKNWAVEMAATRGINADEILTEEQYMDEGTYKAATDEYLKIMRREIEGLVASYHSLSRQIVRESDGSKQHTRLGHKLSKTKQQVADKVKEYNELVPAGTHPRRELADSDDVLSGKFVWAGEALSGCGLDLPNLQEFGVYLGLQLCERLNKLNRCSEELDLIKKELSQYISYCEAKALQTSTLGADIRAALTAEHVPCTLPRLVALGAASSPTAQEAPRRYILHSVDQEMWPSVLRGALAVAQAASQAHLDLAAKAVTRLQELIECKHRRGRRGRTRRMRATAEDAADAGMQG